MTEVGCKDTLEWPTTSMVVTRRHDSVTGDVTRRWSIGFERVVVAFSVGAG